MKKLELDRKVTIETGEPFRLVSLVTQTFLEEIVNALVKDGVVELRGFGKIHLRKQCGTPPPGKRFGGKTPATAPVIRFKVCFSKAASLRKEIQLAKKVKHHGKNGR